MTATAQALSAIAHRQRAVAAYHAGGLSPAQMADTLAVSPATISRDLIVLGLRSVHPSRTVSAGLGPLLRTLREAHGWSLRELATRLGCAYSPLYMLEQEQVGLAPARRRQLATVFAVPPTALAADAPAQGVTWTVTGHPLLLAALRAFATRIGVGVEEVEESTDPGWDMTPVEECSHRKDRA